MHKLSGIILMFDAIKKDIFNITKGTINYVKGKVVSAGLFCNRTLTMD